MSANSRTGGIWSLLIAAAMLIVGLFLTLGGAYGLIVGTPTYYIIAGLIFLVTSVALARNQAWSLPFYALFTLGTTIWALFVSKLDLWGLLPRLDVVLIFGALLLLPLVTRPMGANRTAIMPLLGSVVFGALVLFVSLFLDTHDISGKLPTQIANNTPIDGDNVPAHEWHAYGRTQAGDRWSPLKQINDKNVKNLKVAWVLHTKDLPDFTKDPGESTNEVTPIEFDNTLYLCTLHQKLYSVDAATGKVKWVFDPKLDIHPSFQHLTCRGVSSFTKPDNAVDSDGNAITSTDCSKRIILPVNDGRIIEVDAQTGQKCSGFGQDGEVDIRFSHQPYTTLGDYEPTSPPVITDKFIIVNSAITDNGSIHQPSGATRAYDVYTGKLAWVFDAANADPNEMPSEAHPHFHANSPNSWIVSAYDKNLDLVYIPMGVGTPDQFGGERSKEAERYAPGILALHADTGKMAWFFQTVHHDLWDMDVASQPSLVDITQKDGSLVPAIYIPTKTGDIFVLDRRTGKPIVPVHETKVPGKPVQGDYTAPTQPHSDLSLRPKNPLSDKDMWGATILDQMVCSIYFHTLRYEGPFTPPSLQGTLVFPGDLGMFEWGGLAVDPQRQIAFANPISLPFVSTLVPRGPGNPKWPDVNAKGTGGETGLQHNYGAPYAIDLHGFLNPLLAKIGINLPCRLPPWGYVAGIDLRTNKVVWQHRNGTIQDSMHGSSLPITLPPIKVGVPSLGGPLATAGNLGFLTATMDYYIRAYDLTTGETLWSDRLPAGAQNTPMTYSVNGRQFIVTYAGGHNSFLTKMDDALIAYALPEDEAKKAAQ